MPDKRPGRSVELARNQVTARRFLTEASLENAMRVALALGGSTNIALHFPALAHAAGQAMDLALIVSLSRTTPLIGRFRPSGPRKSAWICIARAAYRRFCGYWDRSWTWMHPR